MIQILRQKILLALKLKNVLVLTLDKLKRCIVISILTVIIYMFIYNVNKFADLLKSDDELQLVFHDTIVSFLQFLQLLKEFVVVYMYRYTNFCFRRYLRRMYMIIFYLFAIFFLFIIGNIII